MSTTHSDTAEPTKPTQAAVGPLTSNRLLARNAAWNMVSQGLPMAVALVSIPWLVRGLGTERFGVMTLSWMVLGYFSLFDLGLGRALTKLVAEYLGRGRPEEVPGLVWTALLMMTGLGLLGTVFVAGLTPWMVGLLNVGAPLVGESRGAFYLMAAALPFLIGTAGLRGVMEAHQRFAGINTVRMVNSVFLQVGPLAVMPFTRSLTAVVGVVALGRFLSWVAHVVICWRAIPGLARGPVVRRDLFWPLLSYGGWMTAVSIINPLMVQMDRFLIGALASAAAVTFYTTPYELVTKSWFLSNAVLGVMFPAFATSYVVDRRRTAEIFGRCLRHVGLVLFPLVLGGVGLAPEVLTVWLGPEFAARSAFVLQCLSVGVLLNGVAQVPSAMLQGIGRPELTFKVHLLELPFYLVAAWLLVRGRGIEGAALAWTGRTAVDLGLYTVVAGWVLPECRPALRGMLEGVAAALAGLAVVCLPLGTTYRIAAVSATAVAFVVVGWLRLLGPGERAEFRRWAERVFGPRPGPSRPESDRPLTGTSQA